MPKTSLETMYEQFEEELARRRAINNAMSTIDKELANLDNTVYLDSIQRYAKKWLRDINRIKMTKERK